MAENAAASPGRDASIAAREKRAAALSSVVAAVVLTLGKTVVGLVTGSLGLLAEAAHSGLDLIAAVMTLVAVRVSGRPADADHPYGHGKVENLSALLETGLLLLTCAWIVYESVRRLFFVHIEVEATVWAFAVMAVSIGIDLSRSRILRRAAIKHHSQALEADALHFSTDIWSSSVVILGLAGVLLARALGISWLAKADAVAALGVSAIVVVVSLKLGRKTVTDLLDGIPADLREDVVRAAHVPGVLEVRRVRIRRSGPDFFVDVLLAVSRHEAFEHAHEIAGRAKAAVRKALGRPEADVVIHVSPSRDEPLDLMAEVRTLAARFGLAAHEVRAFEADGRTALDLHLEIKDAADVAQAHARATDFEEALRQALPDLGRIVTHLEPAVGGGGAAPVPPADRDRIVSLILETAPRLGVTCDPHEIEVEEVGGRLSVAFHCTVDASTGLDDAHRFTEEFELALRAGVPRIDRVLIHVEPPEPAGPEVESG